MLRNKKGNRHFARPVTEDRAPCAFCLREVDDEITYGKLYAIGDIQCHYYCCLLSCCLIQKGNDEEGLFGFMYTDIVAELERCKKHKCSYCGRNGANIGCSVGACRKQFHLPCGREKNAVSLYFGTYKSFCQLHAPKQKIPEHIMAKAKLRRKKNVAEDKKHDDTESPEEMVCVICYEAVEAYPTIHTFWPPCCAKDAWFHRTCLQRMALSAGMHYLKCPLCNDKENFYDAMVNQGYYVPDRDAAWELEQNAFAEIYERPACCSMEECQCPMGREHDAENGKWDIKLCLLCGSAGAHAQCIDQSMTVKSIEQSDASKTDQSEASKTNDQSDVRIQSNEAKENLARSDASNETNIACSQSNGSPEKSNVRFVCKSCLPAASGDLSQLISCIDAIIQQEQAQQTQVSVTNRPIMPSRMSIRRTKGMPPIRDRPSSSRLNQQNDRSTGTEVSNVVLSRQELNLKTPRRMENTFVTETNNYITKENDGNILSPGKLLEQSFKEKMTHARMKDAGLDESTIEGLRKKFRKPGPLCEKKRLVNNILDGVFEEIENSKQREQLKEWCSPKKDSSCEISKKVDIISAESERMNKLTSNAKTPQSPRNIKSYETVGDLVIKNETNSVSEDSEEKNVTNSIKSDDHKIDDVVQSEINNVSENNLSDKIDNKKIKLIRNNTLNNGKKHTLVSISKNRRYKFSQKYNKLNSSTSNMNILKRLITEKDLCSQLLLELTTGKTNDDNFTNTSKDKHSIDTPPILCEETEKSFLKSSENPQKILSECTVKSKDNGQIQTNQILLKDDTCNISDINKTSLINVSRNSNEIESDSEIDNNIKRTSKPRQCKSMSPKDINIENSSKCSSNRNSTKKDRLSPKTDKKKKIQENKLTLETNAEIENHNDIGHSTLLLDTPKCKTIETLQDSSLEISKEDQSINIDVIKIEGSPTKQDTYNKIKSSLPEQQKTCFKFSPFAEEVLQNKDAGIDLESFKKEYLSEVDRKEKIESNINYFISSKITSLVKDFKRDETDKKAKKRKLANDTRMVYLRPDNITKKKRKFSETKLNINEIDEDTRAVREQKSDNKIETNHHEEKRKKHKAKNRHKTNKNKPHDGKEIKLTLNSAAKRDSGKKIKTKLAVGNEKIHLKIKWKKQQLSLNIESKNQHRKQKENKRSKLKQVKDKHSKLKQYILQFNESTSADVLVKPENDVCHRKKHINKQQKTPDKMKQMSIENFFKVKTEK